MIPRIGPTELIIILFIVLIIFGVGRLTDIGGALGKSIREFRKATVEDEPNAPATTDSRDSSDRSGEKPS
jgi:sec-independent protein translocase protein TatA